MGKALEGPEVIGFGLKCIPTMTKQTTVTMFYMCCVVFAHAKKVEPNYHQVCKLSCTHHRLVDSSARQQILVQLVLQ